MAGNSLRNCICSMFSASVFIAGCSIPLVTAFPFVQITLGAVYMYECPAAPLIPVYVMVCGILALLIMGLLALPKLLCPAAQGHTIWTLWVLSLVLFVFVWFIVGSYHIYSVYPPNYTKNTIDQNNFKNSTFAPTTPDNKTSLTLENQDKSLPNLNQTWMTNNNQTLGNVILTLALSKNSSETNRERLNAPQARRVTAAVAYCDRTVYLFAFWTTTLVYVFAGNALVVIVCTYGCIKLGSILTVYLTA